MTDWILKAVQIKEPIVEVSPNVDWLLLGCVLQQNISIADLQTFLLALQKEIKNIAELPAPGEELILSVIKKCKLQNWKLAQQAAGIVWSVGRFIRARNNRLDEWARSSSPSDIWLQCGDIFYMGKTNPLRPKVLAFMHRLSFLLPLGKGKMPPLPNTAGAKRWLINTNAYNPDYSPKDKLRAANALYKELYPEKPSYAWHALQFFCEPISEGVYFCQRIFPCDKCPAAEFCRVNR